MMETNTREELKVKSEGFTRGDQVRVLRGKHKGKEGTFEKETHKDGYTVYTVVFSFARNEYAYFGTGDLEKI